MAKFLQETIAETGTTGSKSAEAAKEFTEFFRKVNLQIFINFIVRDSINLLLF
jgi:hypothetical protein